MIQFFIAIELFPIFLNYLHIILPCFITFITTLYIVVNFTPVQSKEPTFKSIHTQTDPIASNKMDINYIMS